MLERTEDSYVWIYENSGVAVVSAAAMALPTPPIPRSQATIGQLVAAGLKCTAGDRRIGRDLDQPIVASLDTMLRRLSAERAIEFTLNANGED